MSHILKIAISLSVTAVVCALLVITARVNNVVDAITSLGSVNIGNEGLSTTTPTIPDLTVLKDTGGTLMNVSLSAHRGGRVIFYDATTSNANLRVGATSTLVLFELHPTSSSTSYILDARFTRGLLVDYEGNAPTTTVTWR